MKANGLRHWLVDVIVGGGLGVIVGAILAVNLILVAGLERGYESSLRDVFESSTVLGIVVVALFLAGPLVGIAIARRRRSKSGPARMNAR